jgi:WD40 repeat protein
MDAVVTPVTGTQVTAVAISPDGTRIAVGNADGTGGVWSRATLEQHVVLAGQTAALGAIAFSPDGSTIATASNDGTAREYRASGSERTTVSGAVCSCGREVSWHGDSMRALVRADDKVLFQTWKIPSGRAGLDPSTRGTNEADLGVVLSPDGALMARWNDNTSTSTVEVLDTRSGRVRFTLPAITVQGVAFTRDDHRLVVADRTGGLHVTTLASGRTVVGHGWTRNCLDDAGLAPAISDDGRRVAVWSFCGQISIGRLATARPLRRYTQRGQLSGIAFDPTGGRIALSSWDGAATVLNVTTMRPVLELVGHTRGVNGVAYSPDGRYLATTSGDNTLRIWDATTGHMLQIDRDPNSPNKPSFSPDGRFVVASNHRDQIRVWEVCAHCDDPAALLAESRSSVVSPLTALEQARIASLDR